ncbi:MAG TPA: hypothetical protein VFJ02_12755 [Vicinamibacterales bacterium]|nr:hypothetical protein [Vicinamibacterales bacterium]
MSTTDHHAYSQDELHNDDVAHEHSDINIQAVITSAAVVAMVCLMTAALMYGLFWFVFEKQAQERDPKLSPLALPATVMPPTTTAQPTFGSAPDPKLLTSEPNYLRGVRTREQDLLHGYGWVDEKAGIARLPIDAAKKLIVERGLPVRPDPISDPSFGTRVPAAGESSSGRVITHPVGGGEPTAPAQTPPAAPAAAPAAEHKGHQ